MEYYSAIKKNEGMPFVGKWIELEIIILSEISQVKKPNITCFQLYVEFSFKMIKKIGT
jgi:hypothetical protein